MLLRKSNVLTKFVVDILLVFVMKNKYWKLKKMKLFEKAKVFKKTPALYTSCFSDEKQIAGAPKLKFLYKRDVFKQTSDSCTSCDYNKK